MKNKIEWKEMGQFVSISIVQMYSIISDTFKKMEVSLGIVEWIVGSGKAFFIERLSEIGKRYLYETQPLVTGQLDLYEPPKVPRKDLFWLNNSQFSVKEFRVRTSVKIETWFDSLRIDGKRVLIKPSVKDGGGVKINGHILLSNLKGQNLLSAHLLDHLMANIKSIPPNYEKMECKDPINTWGTYNLRFYFFDTIYKDKKDKEYVRYMYYQVGGQDTDWEWCEGMKCLDEDFEFYETALVLEEEPKVQR